MSDPRRRYTEEFKREALQLDERDDKTITWVAQDLGIRRDNGKTRDEELSQMRKENAELKEKREILNNALALF